MQEAIQTLSAGNLDILAEAGLLQTTKETVKSLFQIQVYSGLLFFADFMPRQHPPDLVLPIGPSGKYLASVTIREPVNTALDLGCGCGIQALLMAQHTQHVTATDINPRALALTKLNARLNGFPNIEVLEGSYFEPLRGRTFDLVVANLPYVLNPDNTYVYRDMSQGGDTAIRHTVEQMPSYLNEGGYAHMMLNWVHRADQPWWQPIEAWTQRRNADAWIMYSRSQTPEEYAENWIMLSEQATPNEYAQTKERWLKWYQAQRIERIGLGLLTFRRRTSDTNWRCSVSIRQISDETLGEYILHLFKNQDRLSRINGHSALLKRKLLPWNMKIESPSPETRIARTTRGFLIQKEILSATATVIGQLDGRRKLAEFMQGISVHPKDGLNLHEEVLEEITLLINLGMIEPIE